MQVANDFQFVKSEIVKILKSSKKPPIKKFKELLISKMNEKYAKAIYTYLETKIQNVINAGNALKLHEENNLNLKEKLQSQADFHCHKHLHICEWTSGDSI